MKLLSDKKNIFLGFIFSYVSLAISLVGSFLVTPILLRNIGDTNYGLFSFCNSITSWLSLVSSALIASYVYFASKEQKETGCERRTNSLFTKFFVFLGGVVVLVSLVISLSLKFSGFKFEQYSNEENDIILILLFISGMTVASSVFFSSFGSFNNYKKSFAFVRGISIIVSILSYAMNIALTILIKSVLVVALVVFSGSLITGVCNLIYALKVKKMTFEKNNKIVSCKPEILSIFKYSSIIVFSLLIANLDSNLDKTLLGIMVNAESVTMYQLSISFASHLVVLAYTFTDVMRPTIYSLYREGNNDKANEMFVIVSKIQSIVSLFIIGGYVSCGYHFVIFWIGKEKIDVYFYSSVIFLSLIGPLTKSMSAEAHRANNTHKVPTILSFICVLFNLLITILLLVLLDKKYAVWACIIGTIVPRIVFAYILIPIYDKKKINLPIGKYYINLLKNVLLMIAAVVPCVFIAYHLNIKEISTMYKVLIEGFTFVAIYIAEMLVFERKVLRWGINTFLKKKPQESNS